MAYVYEDKNGLRVHRIHRLTASKVEQIRIAVANATAFPWGPYSPCLAILRKKYHAITQFLASESTGWQRKRKP